MRMYRERADGARISKGWGVGVRVSDRADAGPGVYRDGVRGRDSGGRGRERSERASQKTRMERVVRGRVVFF